jgi:hypothetical protein
MADDELLTPTHLKWVSAFVLLVGVGFYFMWGFAFHAFFDFANYTVSVILVLTGLFGTFLYRELERERAAAAPKT